MSKKAEWKTIIRHQSPRGVDPTFDAFVDTWCALTDDQRSRFVDEQVDEILAFDQKGRLIPGGGFIDE
jgi:hypothetical protein